GWRVNHLGFAPWADKIRLRQGDHKEQRGSDPVLPLYRRHDILAIAPLRFRPDLAVGWAGEAMPAHLKQTRDHPKDGSAQVPLRRQDRAMDLAGLRAKDQNCLPATALSKPITRQG